MPLPPTSEVDAIAVKILFDAKDAIERLKVLNKNIGDSATKVEFLKELISAVAKNMGGDFKAATAAVAGLSEALNISSEAIKKVGSEFSKTGEKAKSTGNAISEVGEKAKKTGGQFGEVGKKGTSAFRDIFNTVRGTMTAMVTFFVTSTIQKFFGDSYKFAAEFRGKMAELNFSEAILSQKGMDITKKELEDFVTELGEKAKYLSKSDVTGIIADVANMGAEFNISKENIVGLSEAVAFMQLQEKAFGQEILDSTSIINAALDGRSNFFNKYGINITKAAIKEKAYAMGLAETGSAITKEISNQAAIALLIEQTADKFDELHAAIEKVNPALANEMLISKKSKDAQLEVGDALIKVKDAWNEFLASMIESGDFDSTVDKIVAVIDALAGLIGLINTTKDTLDSFNTSSEDTEKKMGDFSEWFGVLQTALTVIQLIFLGFMTIAGAIVTAIGALADFVSYFRGDKTFNELGLSLGKRFADGFIQSVITGLKPLIAGKNGWLANRLRSALEGLENMSAIVRVKAGETPTQGLPDTPTGDAKDAEGASADLQELDDKLKEIIQDAEEARDKLDLLKDQKEIDLNIKVEQKKDDIDLEYRRKAEDAARDLAKKIEDINRDARQRAEEAKQKAREDELQKELELAQKLKELRQQFLNDLEDALHARDARQVLRLIRDYNNEKQKILDKNALDEQLSKLKLKNELENIEAERKAKIASAQLEYKQKLEDLAIAKKRELEELAIWKQREFEEIQRWYAREQEEINRNIQNKLQALLRGYIQEGKITQEGMSNVIKIIAAYAARGKYAALDMVNFINKQLAQVGGGSIGVSSGGTAGGRVGRPSQIVGGRNGGGNLDGATLGSQGRSASANKSTPFAFGEAGMDMATFTPISKAGSNTNKVFSNLSGGDGGQAVIQLSLSPDLEARIVENALGQTAKVIVNTMRGV